jgi:hypothetical protein
MVRPGGLFVSLHEPKLAAAAFETRNPANWLAYAWYGTNFVERLRPEGAAMPAGQGTDVWLFDEGELRTLIGEADFENVRFEKWNFLRPILVATASLHLDAKSPRLGPLGQGLLKAAIGSDALLRRFLPSRFFASLAFSAEKRAF